MGDIRRIACNYAEGTKTAAKGSLAFVFQTDGGNGHARLFILSRSRSGRWIERWEPIEMLKNFRAKTIPEESPLYRKVIYGCDCAALMYILQAAEAHAGGH